MLTRHINCTFMPHLGGISSARVHFSRIVYFNSPTTIGWVTRSGTIVWMLTTVLGATSVASIRHVVTACIDVLDFNSDWCTKMSWKADDASGITVNNTTSRESNAKYHSSVGGHISKLVTPKKNSKPINCCGQYMIYSTISIAQITQITLPNPSLHDATHAPYVYTELYCLCDMGVTAVARWL